MRRFKNILAVVDTSFESHPALSKAAELARENQAQLHVIDIVPDFGWPAKLALLDRDALHQLLVKDKLEALEKLVAPLQAEGVQVHTSVRSGKSSHEIIRHVTEAGIDLVVRVTKGKHSRREGFLGTTSLRLLRSCPCPVWLIKPDTKDEFHRVVAAVDAGTCDEPHRVLNRAVLDLAASLAEEEGSTLDIVYAWNIFGENLLRDRMRPEEFEALQEATVAEQERLLDQTLEPLGLTSRSPHIHMLHGDASHQIPKFLAAQGADLLVMGTVGRKGLPGFFVGNTAERILDKVQCSILAVPPC